MLLCLTVLTVDVEPASGQIAVRVRMSSSEVINGRLESLSTLSVRISNAGQSRSIDATRILSITATAFDDIPPPRVSGTPWVFLASGDRLRLKPSSIDEEEVTARWSEFSALESIAIPLESCVGIATQLPSESFAQGRAISRLMEHRGPFDLLTLRNTDSVNGEFLAMQDGFYAIETPLGEIRTEASKTQSIAFNPELVSVPEQPLAFVMVTLRDGSVMRLVNATSDGDVLTGELTVGPRIQIPVLALRSIRFFDSNRIDLSQIPADRTDVTPFLSMRRMPLLNRNVLGGMISQREQLSPTGIGMISGTELVWDLTKFNNKNVGLIRSFQAEAGIDDAAGGGGHVIAEIFVDDLSVWRSKPLTGHSVAVRTPMIDLRNATRLKLRVETAEQGHVLDFVNWFNMILTRQEPPPPELPRL